MNFGWISPELRTPEQQKAWEDAYNEMPAFSISGPLHEAPDKVLLTDVWKHPDVVAALGFPFPGIHQLTGSCVGAGGGNVLFTTIATEVVQRGESEKITIPFWLLTYGRSRYHAGMRGEGEGSFGAAFAKAAKEDGTLDALAEGLPRFKNSDGLIWGSATEMKWSAGDRIAEAFLSESRVHIVKTTAPCKTAEDVKAAITNGYAVTCASNWGGQMECPIVEGVLLNKRVTSWGHQMSVQGFFNHKSLGPLYLIKNTWGDAHGGPCPTGAPSGSFWIKEADMQWICNTGEVFAFSQFEGFPSRKLSWLI